MGLTREIVLGIDYAAINDIQRWSLTWSSITVYIKLSRLRHSDMDTCLLQRSNPFLV
jgi:hypothetical protein